MSGEGPFPEDAGVSSDSSVPGDFPDDEGDETDESDESDGPAASPGTGGQTDLNPETDDEIDRAERHD